MAFSPDGKRIVLNEGPALKLYDIATGQEIRAFKGHVGPMSVLAFSPDGKRIIGGRLFRQPLELKVWDVETGQQVLDLIGHMETVTCVAFSLDGKRIVSGSSGDRTVRVWDAESGQETITLKGYTGYIASVNFSPDGRRILSTERLSYSGEYEFRTWIGELKVWDALVGPGVK